MTAKKRSYIHSKQSDINYLKTNTTLIVLYDPFFVRSQYFLSITLLLFSFAIAKATKAKN